ncbi:zona pellucida-binding protein 2 isoform X2 [Callorhinchus milii]|uniref:zona pellucida-binding protein 2 isoform X2 n=1 Tax=Callorhinchus milii TaxID=7868 RepID=UPI001C3F7F44|nr:zona pellucida-binding protein 2 isoform X2 [Callorhinchus milii]
MRRELPGHRHRKLLAFAVYNILLSTALVKVGAPTDPQVKKNGTDRSVSKIFGSSNSKPVKVYVKIYHDSPILLCTTEDLKEHELIDPYFIWIGPSGKNIKGESYAKITETGRLILKSFRKFMSGDYTCTVSYKNIEKKKEIFLDMKFSVYVDPFANGWEALCKKLEHNCQDELNRRVENARNRVQAFFMKQSIVLAGMKNALPTFYYIDNSLQVSRVDHCRPGFGKNKITHSDCSECCVVCDHGMYSPTNDVNCLPCTSIRINFYGATAC